MDPQLSVLFALAHLGLASTEQLHALCLSHVRLRQAQSILVRLVAQRLLTAHPRSFVVAGLPRRRSTAYTLAPLGFAEIRGQPAAPAQPAAQFNRVLERSLDLSAQLVAMITQLRGEDVSGIYVQHKAPILTNARYRCDALVAVSFNREADEPLMERVRWQAELPEKGTEPAVFALHLADEVQPQQLRRLAACYQQASDRRTWQARIANTPVVLWLAEDGAQRRRIARVMAQTSPYGDWATMSRVDLAAGRWGRDREPLRSFCNFARYG